MSKLPDFEGLAMFAKVAEERSFAAAARAMGVSVATVSRAVSRLEERLGGRLFNRTSRRLALTDYGHTLAERASKIFADPLLETDNTNDSDFQSKIAQQTTDIVLDRKSLFLEYLSSGEERPSFLACKRLDVLGSE